MEELNRKLQTFQDALATLASAIAFREEHTMQQCLSAALEEKYQAALQDSVIQRFEYCTDLFWKVLRIYLEQAEKLRLESISPKAIIRTAINIRFISETTGEDCIAMIINRNETSHLYHRDLAAHIAGLVPSFYETMKAIAQKMQAAAPKK